jgi:multiple sugar transport system permease protein
MMLSLAKSLPERLRIRPARVGDWALNIFLVAIGLLMLAPVYWAVVISVAPPAQAFSLPPPWLPTGISVASYGRVFDLIPLGLMALNSIKITAIVTLGALVSSSLAAYAFARLEFPGRDILFIVFLAALMIPTQSTVVPLFILMSRLNLINTHEAIYLPALVQVLGIFLLRQWFLSIPRELEDAAKVDGAGHLRTLVQIIIPISGPALSAVAIFVSQHIWNDFFFPLIFLSSPEKMTIPVGLVQLQAAQAGTSATVIFAAISMVVVPLLLLFVFAQNRITESMAMTGIRG